MISTTVMALILVGLAEAGLANLYFFRIQDRTFHRLLAVRCLSVSLLCFFSALAYSSTRPETTVLLAGSIFMLASDGLFAFKPSLARILPRHGGSTQLGTVTKSQMAPPDTGTRPFSQVQELMKTNAALEEDLQQCKLEEMQWRRRVYELESLANLTAALRTARSIQEMLAVLVRETVSILEADAGVILLRKGNDLVVKSCYGVSGDLKGYCHPFERDTFWKVYEGGQTIIVTSGSVHPSQKIPAFFPQMATTAIFSLNTPERQLGVFVLGFNKPKELGDSDQKLVAAIGNITSNALYRSNAMDTLEQRVISRNRELETLYQVVSLANEAKEPNAILGQTLNILLETLNAKTGVIFLNDRVHEVRVATRLPESLSEIESDLNGIAFENSIWRYVYHTNQPLLVEDLEKDNRIDIKIVTELMVLGDCSCIGSPVRGSTETIGAMCIFKDSESPFTPEDLALLNTASHQLGIAIEIIRLRKLEERNAIWAERQRLAGELHDSISQLLSSQYLYAEASQNLIQNGDCQKAQEYMDQIRKASHQALKEMRLLIHELRPAPIESLGLYDALKHRLETVERRANIEATLQGEYNYRLPGNMEEGLYMIAQDALNYSIKNAQATQVTVKLDSDYDSIALEIEDNGRAISPASIKEKNGLSRMSERVQNMGGKLKIKSNPGKGNTLRITI